MKIYVKYSVIKNNIKKIPKKHAAYLQDLVDQVAPEYLPKDKNTLTPDTDNTVQHIRMDKQ